MFKNMSKNTSKIISAFLLISLAFVFLHSEVGLLDVDGSNHSSHDYCEILQTAVIKITSSDPSSSNKLQVEKTTSIIYVSKTNLYTKTFSVLDLKQFYTPQKTTEVYLLNQSFLI